MPSNNGNGHDWEAIRAAFEVGEPWSKLQAMGPSKSTISKKSKRERWDASRRNGNGKHPPKRTPSRANTQRTGANTEQPVRPKSTNVPAPDISNLVKPEAIDAALHSGEELEKTLAQIEQHARAGNNICIMAGKLVDAVKEKVFEKGTLKLKKDVSVKKATQAAYLLLNSAKAIEKANGIYRRNRGLDGVTRIEHSGDVNYNVADARRELEREFGFNLGGVEVESSPISTGVPEGSAPS